MNCTDEKQLISLTAISKKRLILTVVITRKDDEREDVYQKRVNTLQPALIEFMNRVKKRKPLNDNEFIQQQELLQKERQKKQFSKINKSKLSQRIDLIGKRVDACLCGPALTEVWELDEGIDPEDGGDAAQTRVREESGGTILDGQISSNVGFDLNIHLDENYIDSDLVNRRNNCNCCHCKEQKTISLPKKCKIKVAIIDGGIDYQSHPILANLSWNPSTESLIGACYVSRNYDKGYNFSTKTSGGMDVSGHGTHIAGIIAGFCRSYTNEQNTFPHERIKLELLNLKIGNKSFGLAEAVCAIHYAISMKVDVINLSWGFYTSNYGLLYKNKVQGDSLPPTAHPLTAALERAERNGIIVCTSAGNSGIDLDQVASKGYYHYPSEYSKTIKTVLSVGSVGKNGNNRLIAEHSNRGKQSVSLNLPGNCIESLRRTGGTVYKFGTSMAAAQATRIVSIVKCFKGKGRTNKTLKILNKKLRKLEAGERGQGYLPESSDEITY